MMTKRAAVLALMVGATLACAPSATAASLAGLTATYLSEIRYSAGGGEVNVVDYASSERRYAEVCNPFAVVGPGQCLVETGVGQEAHHFADGRGRLWSASGWCKLVTASLGTCHGPSDDLVITLNLADGNDELRVYVAAGSSPKRRFQVSGSAGDDLIRLIDHSGGTYDFDARERIFCGSGTDQVVTTKNAVVSTDCEQVTRL